jgi:hypothetical protein
MPVSYEWRGAFTNREVHALHAEAFSTGCEYLHVDFEDHLSAFYYGACGFRPAKAGLLPLAG